jgi:hypothetical protein
VAAVARPARPPPEAAPASAQPAPAHGHGHGHGGDNRHNNSADTVAIRDAAAAPGVSLPASLPAASRAAHPGASRAAHPGASRAAHPAVQPGARCSYAWLKHTRLHCFDCRQSARKSQTPPVPVSPAPPPAPPITPEPQSSEASALFPPVSVRLPWNMVYRGVNATADTPVYHLAPCAMCAPLTTPHPHPTTHGSYPKGGWAGVRGGEWRTCGA